MKRHQIASTWVRGAWRSALFISILWKDQIDWPWQHKFILCKHTAVGLCVERRPAIATERMCEKILKTSPYVIMKVIK